MIPYADTADKNRIEDEFDPEKDEEFYLYKGETVKWYDQILLNRPLKVALSLLVVAIIIPALVYHYILTDTLDLPPADGYSTGSCILPRTRRIPCGAGNVTRDLCHTQCCYDEENNLCFHRLPSRFSYIIDRPWSEQLTMHPRIATEPFANTQSVPSLRMIVDEVSITHVSFQIYDPNIIQPASGRVQSDKLYDYDISTPELDIKVYADDRVLLETDRGPLVAAHDIWEISFRITNETMFGLEEIPLLPGTTKVLYNHQGSSSPLPLIFARSQDSFHAVLFESRHPAEIQVLQQNHLLFRCITDEGLKFHVFAGPTPEDIMRDVMRITGGEPEIPYWMLGPHYCAENQFSLNEQYDQLTAFIKESQEEGLPIDSHCGVKPITLKVDEDEEERRILALGEAAVKEAGILFLPHLSPYIKFHEHAENFSSAENTEMRTSANQEFMEKLIRDPKEMEKPYLGLIGDDAVVYPDYSMPNSSDMLNGLWPLSSNIRGIILENNWPLDESEVHFNETHSHFPYFSKEFEIPFARTVIWNATHPNAGLRRQAHIFQHNSYGEQFTEAVKNLMKNQEIPLLSTSQWLNGKVSNNRQNVAASWTNLRKELVIAALGGISGNWLRNSPVCGDAGPFDSEQQLELCMKWYQASTYFPLVKVHSNGVRRDPFIFTGVNRRYAIEALKRRLSLSPYFYTVLQNGPLLRPMFYQYPYSQELHNLSTQFSVGDALLIVPNLLPQQVLINVWLPYGAWYELWGGLQFINAGNQPSTVATTIADFFVLVQGGNIIALQEEVQSTSEATRLHSPFSLVLALDCNVFNDTCYAEGEIILTKRMSIVFSSSSDTLTIRSVGDDWDSMCGASAIWNHHISSLKIYGLNQTLNNYDTYRYVSVSEDLCDLKDFHPIVTDFVN